MILSLFVLRLLMYFNSICNQMFNTQYLSFYRNFSIFYKSNYQKPNHKIKPFFNFGATPVTVAQAHNVS
ncbi:hypothetical protein BWZ22_11895 [Seonamhaeicola sp. S2-3]|nr:hypothetical protein BWZ22_11895 [Seonamhaeicola sp. S2-3]